MISNRRARLMGCAASLLMIACGGAPEGVQRPKGEQSDRIVVVLKLDPSLRGGTYGGEVWVSPPVYVGAVGQDVVEARARGVDASGHSTTISPSWVPSDPAMLTVWPDHGDQVTIVVKRAGESHLNVTSEGTSKALLFKASAVDGAVTQVEIFQ
jgi:hypothetical protein